MQTAPLKTVMARSLWTNSTIYNKAGRHLAAGFCFVGKNLRPAEEFRFAPGLEIFRRNSRVARRRESCHNQSAGGQVPPLPENKTMKTGNAHWFKLFTIAALLLLANRSHALFTPYLTVASNEFAAFAATLTNGTPHDRAEANALARALRDLSKPSDSAAGDYKLFVAAATHLGPFALQPPFGEAGSNLFNIFMLEAQIEIGATAARIAASPGRASTSVATRADRGSAGCYSRA